MGLLPFGSPPSKGQANYTAVVAVSGGDYTTLSAAVAAVAAGSSIFVKSGTYTETGFTSTPDNLTIIGESMEATILNFGTNNPSFTGNNNIVRDLTLKVTTGVLTLGTQNGEFQAVYFDKEAVGLSSSANFIIANAAYTRILDCYFDCNNDDTAQSWPIQFTGPYQYVAGCSIWVASFGNGDVYVSGDGTKITDNYIKPNGYGSTNSTVPIVYLTNQTLFSSNYIDMTGSGNHQAMTIAGSFNLVHGNDIQGTGSNGNGILFAGSCSFNNVSNNTIGNVAGYGIDTSSSTGGTNNNFSNNVLRGTTAVGSVGINCIRDNSILNGNNILSYATGIVNASTKSIITSNILLSNTTALNDTGTSTVNANNVTA